MCLFYQKMHTIQLITYQYIDKKHIRNKTLCLFAFLIAYTFEDGDCCDNYNTLICS